MKNIVQIIFGSHNQQNIILKNNENDIAQPDDIYFTYGDSDVQILLRKEKYRSNGEYYKFMSNAFKLLLLFKPFSSRIVISASSLLSSQLTYNLIIKYKCFTNPVNPHFSILRKESSWVDYYEKRKHNTRKLSHFERYKLFLNREFIKSFEEFATIRKINNSGIDTSKEWIKAAKLIIPKINLNPKSNLTKLDDLSDEILYDSIFVWEAINEKLHERGIKLPQWNNQLQIALVESYFSSFAQTILLPTRDILNINIGTNHNFYFTNITLLNYIIDRAGISKEFESLTPEKLLQLIQLDELLKYKMRLEQTISENDLLLEASKNKKLLIKSFKQVMR